MKILLDTNIILDHLLDRAPFSQIAETLFIATEKGELTSFVSANAVTTIYYLAAKTLGAKAAHTATEQLLRLFEVAPVSRTVLSSALLLKFSDFEDAVVHEAAVHAGVQAIITRNGKDFRHATLAVYSPDEFVASFNF